MQQPKVAVDCKVFQMMHYIIVVKVRKLRQPTANRFTTARQKPIGRRGGGGGHNVPSCLPQPE